MAAGTQPNWQTSAYPEMSKRVSLPGKLKESFIRGTLDGGFQQKKNMDYMFQCRHLPLHGPRSYNFKKIWSPSRYLLDDNNHLGNLFFDSVLSHNTLSHNTEIFVEKLMLNWETPIRACICKKVGAGDGQP